MYGQAIEKHRQWPKAKEERIKVDALTLSVLLPDMRPYYPEDDAKWKKQGHGDRVEVTIKLIKDSEQGWYDWLRKRIHEEATNGGRVVMNSEIYELNHFSEPTFDKYFPVSEIGLYINCDRAKPDFSPSCFTKSNYYRGIVLEYYYGLDHLPHWKEIDTALKSMFNNFIQSDKSEQ